MSKNESKADVPVRERRSASRLKFEETGEMNEDVSVGIKGRVENLLEGEVGQEAVFSASAAETIRSISSDIILRKGSIVVQESDADPYGTAFVSRDWDNGHLTTADIPEGARLSVKRIPAVSIPETAVSPYEVASRTDRGELKFEYTPSKTMAIAQFKDGQWSDSQFIPSGSIEIGPLSDRYGQSIFGGSRALRLADGRVALFRPVDHAKRFNANAERECMPHLTNDQLVDVYMEVVRANMAYIGKPGEQSLYLAPGLRATRNQLGVKPNSEYLFTCFGVPAGKIFSTPAKLRTETEFHRAARGGFGDVKHSGNYSPTFGVKKDAHAGGYDDIVFLDEKNEEIRELSSSNLFFVTNDGVLVTPSLSGEILPGITRNSILHIAEEFVEQGLIKGIEERTVTREKLARMAEGFSCGTGVTMNGIESIDDSGSTCRLDISCGGMGRISRMIYDKFNRILAGEEIDTPRYNDWLLIVE
jgi:branched-chain amino acid aminotransferase